jgi:hypothetical protein
VLGISLVELASFVVIFEMNLFSADTSNTSSMVDPIRPNPNGRLHQDWTAADAQQENTSLMCATTIESRAALSATG